MPIVPLSLAADRNLYGGKASALAHSMNAGLPVPDGFALSPDVAEHVATGHVPSELEALWEAAGLVAVRSSGTAEDGESASFAGQFATKLGVARAGLVDAVREVIASATGVAGYQAKMGSSATVRMAVVVQRLINPYAAGVLFTRNPVTGADERVIEACYGLGEAVVSGLVTPDTYRVARGGAVLDAKPGYKDIALEPVEGGGTRERAIEERVAWFRALDDAMLRQLDVLATTCETVFGGPRDIEWAITEPTPKGAKLVLLQCRPVTTGLRKTP